ncbi:MAG TPA: glycosyltransferase family 4 protein [Candidatus Limnocylindrales bacterium]|nr:glycosyltransferase family 4 protein [Candidatus Limnocylindrales bacterium]
MTAGGTIGLAARSAIRHPRATWRRVAGQKLKALVRVLAMVPARQRAVAGRFLDRIAAARMRRRRDDRVGAVLRVVGQTAAGRRREALTFAESLATDPAAAVGLSFALARAALAVDAVDVAERIVDAVAGRDGADSPTALAVRADRALRTGRYSDAASLARRALEHGGGGRAHAILDRAESELRVLAPGWRPSIDARAPRSPIDVVPGRVLHLLTNSLPYRQAGYTVRAQSIARSQVAAGLDPHMATRAGFPMSEGVGRAPREERVDGIPYHRLATNLEPAAGPDRVATETANALTRLAAELRPAVLHPASNFINAQAALAVGERLGIPVVYEVRGFLEETWASRRARTGGDTTDDAARDRTSDADRYAGGKAAETAVMLAARAVVTLSETMRVDIVARGCDPERVVVVPNAVDIDRFTPRPRDAALAASLGIEPGETVLGYVSTFTGYEGIRYLIEAAAILRERGRAVRVLLVGDGEERPALEAEARRLGVADRTVVFTGRVPHDTVNAYYSVIDVFVVPRTNDRVSQLVTPLKPYEAMALERAIVVSGVAALREIVTDGETGLTFKPEDARDLANVVEPLLDDPARRATLGRAAREWVAANRTWRQNGRRYRELYERLGVPMPVS